MRALTSSPAASRARTSRTPGRSSASPARAQACGRRCSVSCARYDDRRSSSWRTSPRFARAASKSSSATWPRAGFMRNGIAFPRRPLVPLTSAIDSSLWPTPNASDGMVLRFSIGAIRLNLERGHQRKSAALLRLKGVPTDAIPAFYEWAMGFPPQWTDCAVAATRSSRRSPSTSAGASHRSTRRRSRGCSR